MEQYEKSGPKVDLVKKEKSQRDIELQRLEKSCEENAALIRDLQKELQRFKNKLDEHARIINQLKRNG